MTFQRQPVRSSVSFYRHFNLAMGRSLSFASAADDWIALFRLAFATAPLRNRLTLPPTVTRRFIMQKARGHTREQARNRAPTACRCTVSGTFNSPDRGTFHLSVALLFTIGRRVVLSLGWWATLLHAEFHGLHATLGLLSTEGARFRIRGCHPLCPAFPDRSSSDTFVTPRGPATPGGKPPGLGYVRFRSPLLTESRLISFPAGT